MEPDKYQQAWQAHTAQTRVTVDADLLLEVVQRSQRNFRAVIFWRDFREVGIALLLLPVWVYLGVVTASPWTWYLTMPVLVWMAGFMLVYRMRHPQKPSEPDEPLLQCVENSLTEVEDQIWLLRNIFWWYLLPPFLSISVFFVHVGWLVAPAGRWLEALVSEVMLAVVYGAIYFLNQYAVHKQLEPRRQELLTLLARLRDETAGDDAGDHVSLPALPFAEERLRAPCTSPARVAIGMVGIVVVMLFLVALVVAMVNTDPHLLTGKGYPKRSPFAAVRWQEYQPEVQVGDEWFRLVSLDDVPASDIVAFSRETYSSEWRKRFEEDLVELLTRMGHEPGDTVRLVVRPLGSSTTRTFEDVPMTYANRRAIRNAAQARERREPRQETRSTMPFDDAQASITELIAGLRQEKKLVGLAAMVAIDGQVVASAVDGERKKGSAKRLEIGDRWHLGSITKSITATMIARLVESGRMQWSDSIGQCFPDASVHDDWKSTTSFGLSDLPLAIRVLQLAQEHIEQAEAEVQP